MDLAGGLDAGIAPAPVKGIGVEMSLDQDQDPPEEKGKDGRPLNPWIVQRPTRFGTAWKTSPTNPQLLLVSFSVDGEVVAEVEIPGKTPMREIETVAIKRMETL